MVLEPIPETCQAIEELEPLADDDVLSRLCSMGSRVREIVPDCLGVSLATRQHGVTFLLLASRTEIAVLDAFQQQPGSPAPEVVPDTADPLDEHTWWLGGRATAASGVATTLTLPIVDAGTVTGSVNLYGGSVHAFDGHHEQLAEVFSAWAPGAVSNADLSFAALGQAREAPSRLRAEARLAAAVGLLAGYLDITVEHARRLLSRAARRAGIDEVQLAEALLGLAQGGSTD
ncbi:hypothetical protein ACT8ZV_18635 [Nocardioides sp. MAHUQ-72]|uniref:hypothetical protein n=1 Tax=unclassified Nocardioides TaxID=2615069 RepID=UPI003608BA6C